MNDELQTDFVRIFHFSDGSRVEVGYTNDGQWTYVKPLDKPIGMIFYL